HRSKTNPRLPHHVRKSDSVVHNLDLQTVARLNAHPAYSGSSVAHNIGDSFLHDAQGRHFYRGRKGTDSAARDIDFENGSARHGQTCDTGLNCASEAKLVQHWRTQVVHDCTQIVDGLFEVRLELCEHGIRAVHVARQQPARGAGPQYLPGQHRAQAVVQVTP